MTITNDVGLGLGGPWGRRGSRHGSRLTKADWYNLGVYLRRAGFTALAGWAAAAAYLFLVPVSYVSQWTLILPGEGHNNTMSIESVGQATSSTNSAFGSVSLSPKVVYKEIADSDVVREAAAKSVNLTFREFGRPKVKLIDETSLMLFEIAGPNPEVAHRKAVASIAALNAQLEILRKDEVEKRSEATTRNLKSYKDQVDAARHEIAAISKASGLVSINQFNETVASLAALQRRLSEVTAEAERMEQEQAGLVARMGLEPSYASIALRLAGDASLAKVISDFADSNAAYTAESLHLGANNPVLINLDKRRIAALESLKRLMSKLDVGPDIEGRAVVMLTNISHQAELLQQLVRNEAALKGKRQEIATISAEKARVDGEVSRLSGVAAKLEDLKKDHLLAEAVYSSALARVDTSKSELFGAYPIVQVLAPPTVPESQEQPKLSYALAGGFAATLFSALTWGLAWQHSLQTTRRRKKSSPIG